MRGRLPRQPRRRLDQRSAAAGKRRKTPLSPDPVIGFEGIPSRVTDDIVIMPYNDMPACEKIIRANVDKLAAVIVEPVNGQSGFIPAEPEFWPDSGP